MNIRFVNSRSRILAALILGVMAVFVVRLFYLQIIMHDEYVAKAEQEQIKPLTILAKRGQVYSLDAGTPNKLVMNETVYTVFADPQIVIDADKIVETVKKVAGGNARPELDKLLDRKDTRYQILATRVSRSQAEMMKKESLRGLGFQETTQRVYPEGKLGSQILGFVNAEGNGQYGIEGKLNARLTGTNGLLQTVTDVNNVPLSIGDKNIKKPAQNGDDIVLSVDRNIQAHVERALADGLKRTGATHASALVMDPQTGRVLAMANLPDYSPAEYNKVQDGALFNNATVSAPYEAGSVIKTLTVAAGIDKGVIQPDSTYVNTDTITVEDRTIKNATKGQTGTITMQTALDYSLNTGMVTIAQRLGDGTINRASRDTLYGYYHDRFGLGMITGIEVTGEAAGQVISPKEQEGNAVRYSNMSFGQGMNVTMVQVAGAFSSLINGGTYYQPSLVAGVMKDGRYQAEAHPAVRSGVVSADTSNKVRGMINSARQRFYAGQDTPGYEIGGKTGTSQTLQNGQYVDNETVGSYLGYGGDNVPRYVIMVQVSGKGMNLEGGKHAGPIFTDISNWMIGYMKLAPKG